MSVRLPPIVKSAIAFIAGFVVLAILIHVVAGIFGPKPHIGLIQEKRGFLEKNGQNYNLIFLGTSQTFRNIDPAAIKGGAQCAFKPYNAGVPGLTLEELSDYIDALESTSTVNKPRLIVFTDPLPPKPKFSDATNVRTQAYTSIENLGTRLQNVWSLPEPLWKRLALSGFVGTAQIYNAFNIGRFSQWLFPERYNSEARENTSPMKEGFPSLTYDIDNDPTIAKRHELFQETAKDWQENVLDKYSKEPFQKINDVKAYRKRVRILSELAARISQAGDIPILIIFPEPETLKQDRTLESAITHYAPELPVLMIAEPLMLPELWDASMWFDKTHLNERGAEILSKEIAAPLCRFYKNYGEEN